MPSNFSLLLDELHAADQGRQRGATLAKASGGDNWVAEWVATRRERDSAAGARSLRANLDAMDRLTAEMSGMAKAMPAPMTLPAKATPREAFTKAFGHFQTLVAAGELSTIDVCRAEARFHHLADRLRAAGHL